MNKLEELHNLRERAGIVFTKSFNCEDAERNIHLCDKDKFFQKFKEKLYKLGYKPIDSDFSFEIIRHKYNYAERHHIGKTYEWKYFYSTTFDISQELIDYLLKHNFITGIDEQKNKTCSAIMTFEKVIEKNKNKIERFTQFLKSKQGSGQDQIINNYKQAIANCYSKIENCEKKMAELKQKEQQNEKI